MKPALEKPTSFEEYIDDAPKEAQKRLREMRACLLKAAPGAAESLKWSVPAMSYKRILFTYAAFKNHISLFPTPAAIKAFAEDLAEYRTSSSTIQFPLEKPLPVAVIRKIAIFRVKECEEKDARWM
jgi:uncharacterized protein YdhG (YjbR/CyaY superfamily)